MVTVVVNFGVSQSENSIVASLLDQDRRLKPGLGGVIVEISHVEARTNSNLFEFAFLHEADGVDGVSRVALLPVQRKGGAHVARRWDVANSKDSFRKVNLFAAVFGVQRLECPRTRTAKRLFINTAVKVYAWRREVRSEKGLAFKVIKGDGYSIAKNELLRAVFIVAGDFAAASDRKAKSERMWCDARVRVVAKGSHDGFGLLTFEEKCGVREETGSAYDDFCFCRDDLAVSLAFVARNDAKGSPRRFDEPEGVFELVQPSARRAMPQVEAVSEA